MLLFNLLLALTVTSALLAAAFWVRVASSRSLNEAFKLDGTERLSRRNNRRALTSALTISAVAVLLAVAAWLVGRGTGA